MTIHNCIEMERKLLEDVRELIVNTGLVQYQVDDCIERATKYIQIINEQGFDGRPLICRECKRIGEACQKVRRVATHTINLAKAYNVTQED